MVALKVQARAASIVVKVLAVGLLVSQLWLGMSLENLWALYFSMQIICYLKIYDSPFPANVQMYMDQFTDTLEFDLINPQSLV